MQIVNLALARHLGIKPRALCQIAVPLNTDRATVYALHVVFGLAFVCKCSVINRAQPVFAVYGPMCDYARYLLTVLLSLVVFETGVFLVLL